MRNFTPNDYVVCRQTESSTRPVPGARDVHPAPRGDFYTYAIDHLWRVVRVTDDGTVEAISASGRVHRVCSTDPMLKRASWWSRLGRRARFPTF